MGHEGPSAAAVGLVLGKVHIAFHVPELLSFVDFTLMVLRP